MNTGDRVKINPSLLDDGYHQRFGVIKDVLAKNIYLVEWDSGEETTVTVPHYLVPEGQPAPISVKFTEEELKALDLMIYQGIGSTIKSIATGQTDWEPTDGEQAVCQKLQAALEKQ